MKFLLEAHFADHNDEEGKYVNGKPDLEDYTVIENELRAALIERRNLLAAQPAGPVDPPKNEVDRIKRVHDTQAVSKAREIRLSELAFQIGKCRAAFTRGQMQFDDNGMIIGSKKIELSRVVYDHDPDLQKLTRIHVRGGLCYGDDKCQTLFDTGRMSNYWSGSGMAIYVMSGNGNLHASSQLKNYRHHTSLLAGANVAGAGELQIDQGILKKINNQSGHYLPEPAHLYQVVHQLKRLGIPLNFQVTALNAGGKTREQNADEFLKEGRIKYQDNRLLAYVAPASPALLDKLGWHFVGFSRKAGTRPGVYDKVTKKRIPYKQVVGAMKAAGIHPDATLEMLV